MRMLLVLATLLLFPAGVTRLPGAQPAAVDFHAVDAYVSAWMEAERIPGVAIAIVRDTLLVHARGFGTDGAGRPVTPQTSFVIGSMSKSIAALALMQLVEAGRVDVDAPVQRYLPYFTVRDTAAAARITVRHLLNHTSGIPTMAPRSKGDRTLRAHVEALADTELDSDPGSVHQYSSPNYQVIGAIIEAVTGVSYADYVRANVFDPFGMNATFTSQDSALAAGMSQGHRYWFGFPRAVTLPHEHDRLPTAAIISSATDLGRFMSAQLNLPEGMRAMHEEGVGDGTTSYARGWRVTRDAHDRITIHHGGIVPHFRGKMVMLPEGKWGVVVLTNVSSALPLHPASHLMADAIAAHLAGAPLPGVRSRFKLVQAVIALLALAITLNMANRARLLWRRWQCPRPVRAAAAPGKYAGADVARERAAGRAKLWRSSLQFVFPVALLVLFPVFTGIPWGEALRSAPDVATWLVAIAVIDILLGFLTLTAPPDCHTPSLT